MKHQDPRPVIDADAHVTEPEDVFTSRISSRWGDLVPHVRHDPATKRDFWFIGVDAVAPAWGNAAAGWEHEWPPYPLVKADVAPAAYDAAARLAVLDGHGIDAQVLYPNVAGFGGERFLDLHRYPELMLACVRAYNDFLVDWMSVAPERFVGVAALPFWDVEASVVELQRAASIGHRGILFSGAPHELGMPYLADDYWNPIWAAAEEAGLPVSFHLGSGDIRRTLDPARTAVEGRASFVSRVATNLFLDIGIQLNELLVSGVLARFPDLQFVMVESGIGHIPFILESADYHVGVSTLRKEKPWFSELPSDYFRRQVSVTFWFEEPAPETIERIGAGNVLFETDYPHTTSLRGAAIDERITSIEAALTGNDADLVLHGNAAELYGVPTVLAAS